MQNMELVMEEPAWQFVGGLFYRLYWTDDVGKHNRRFNGQEMNASGANNADRPTWFYAPGVMMHEFGHTAGLTDLYNFTGHNNYLMGRGVGTTLLPTKDKEYIKQVYHGHSSH